MNYATYFQAWNYHGVARSIWRYGIACLGNIASSPPQLFNIYIYFDIERNLFWLEFPLSNTYRAVVLHGRAAPQILGHWCACNVPRHRWLNFSYGRNLTLSLVHLDLAGAKISASASQVTPLAELIEMV